MARLRRDDAVLGVFAGLLAVVYWGYKGFRVRLLGGPGSAAIKQCQSIVADPIAHFQGISLLYSGFQLPYCAVYQLSGGWIRLWIGIQLILWMATVVFLYRAGRNFMDRQAGIVAAVSTAVLWETFRFAVRPQSDLMNLFALAVALWALSVYEQSPSRRSKTIAGLSLAFLLISRPFGLPIVLGIVLYAFLIRRDARLIRKTTALVLPVLASVSYLATEHLVGNLDISQVNAVSWRLSLISTWAHGVIVTHTTIPTFQYEYTVRSATTIVEFLLFNIDHLLTIAVLKATWVFVPVLSRWSTFHIVMNVVTLTPVIVGGLGGCYLALTRRDQPVLHYMVVPVVCILLPIMVRYVDGGFNYRAPATLLFALLTGYLVSEADWLQGEQKMNFTWLK